MVGKVSMSMSSSSSRSASSSMSSQRQRTSLNSCAACSTTACQSRQVLHHSAQRQTADRVSEVSGGLRGMPGFSQALARRRAGGCVDNRAMSSPKVLFGFHAVGVRLKTAPQSIIEIYFEPTRRDARMRQFLERAREANARLIEADGLRIAKLAGSHGHQGVAARVEALPQAHSLDELLEKLEADGVAPLLLVLDGITDPHNLCACLRVADGAGAHAVIAPKDHAAGISATVAKVASGAAETMPYFMVTNLARTLGELKERNIWCIGTSDDAEKTIYDVDLKGPVALVLGAEGEGMRQLTRKTCDELVRIPMRGAVESLNVSVASGVCLYEALRQRS